VRSVITSVKSNAWIFSLILVTAAYAGSQIDPKRKMITNADAIAIVEIDKVEATQTQAATALYRQRAHAKIERVVKEPPRVLGEYLPLFGDEQQLVDARTHLSTGRFLVFLKLDTVERPAALLQEKSIGGWQLIYAGANGDPSLRPIHGDTVEWYADDHYVKKISAPLKSVLNEIQTVLDASATPNSRGGSSTADK
jgi:hypothetical protein